MNSTAAEIFQDFIALFFPRHCLGCDQPLVKGEESICTRCMMEMPRSNYHLEPENPFYNKLRGRLPVKYVMALFKFVKATRVQHMLHALKYKNRPELGKMLGRLYGHQLLETHREEFDLIVPVPLHKSRLRSRGYNQSREFGLGLSEILNLPCVDVLSRVMKTNTQTRKSKLGRWANVNNVFDVLQPEQIADKKILLVDDVVTTGATLEACGHLLVQHGCRELSIACIAAAQ